MIDDLTNPITNNLREQKRAQYQAIVQKESNTNFTDAEQRAVRVKCIILLVEHFLPIEVKDELHALHLDHKKYNQPELEMVV